MPYLIGTDEAGYGPNYGPLCVSATVWEVDEGIQPVELYKRLRRTVTNCVDRASRRKIAWADSKAIYKSGNGLDHLERGVLTALSLINQRPSHWHELWSIMQQSQGNHSGSRPLVNETLPFSRDAQQSASATMTLPINSNAHFAELPWHADYAAALPLWMNTDDGPAWMSPDAISELSQCVRDALAKEGVRLVAVLCRAVFPAEFNELVEASNKADVLSRVTLCLVADALQFIENQSVEVCCDKHGGRDYYLPLIQTHFEEWVEVRVESSAASNYRFTNNDRQVDIGFYVGGERFLPVALASMTAKYLRETAMRPFNEFWCSRVPGLKPTAGYPGDSRRFRQQIASVQQELEIDDRILWRAR